MPTNHYGGVPSPNRAPRDFFKLTGVGFPRLMAQTILPFPVPDLSRDLLLAMYITPVLAKRFPDPAVRQVYFDVRAYLLLLRDTLNAARRGDQVAAARAIRMLQWPEASELRYGYSAAGSAGNGLGDGTLSMRIYETLMDVPELIEVAIDVPDVLALLPLVSLDRMGDFVGSVAKGAIISLTQHFAAQFFPDSACLRTIDVTGVWDYTEMRFLTRRNVKLPVADDGRAILLPHKKTVRSSPPLRAKQFARHIGRPSLDKPTLIRYIKAHPGVLREFVDELLQDEWRYLPRRMFRD